MDKIIPFTIESNRICPKCKSRSIELINQYNKKIDLDNIDNHKFIFHKLICSNCNSEFMIEWNGDEMYVARDDYSKRSFLENNFYNKKGLV